MVVSNIFYFHPYLGKWSNLTNIFQWGWNHQLESNCEGFVVLHEIGFSVECWESRFLEKHRTCQMTSDLIWKQHSFPYDCWYHYIVDNPQCSMNFTILTFMYRSILYIYVCRIHWYRFPSLLSLNWQDTLRFLEWLNFLCCRQILLTVYTCLTQCYGFFGH